VSVATRQGASLEVHLNDQARVNFMSGYLAQVLAATRLGCNVRGYFHWSFFDNFEWTAGAYTRPLFQLNLSRFCLKITLINPLIPPNTPYIHLKQPLDAPLPHRKR